MSRKQVEVIIPTELRDITLSQYFLYFKLVENVKDDKSLEELLITTFCNISLQDLRELDNSQVLDIINRLGGLFSKFNGEMPFVRRFTLNGVEYGFIPNLDNISYGENVDICNNISEGSKGMAKAMGILYRPVLPTSGKKNYEIEKYTADPKYTEIMKDMPVDVMLGAQVFFWTLTRDLLLHIPSYLKKQVETPQLKELIERANTIKSGELMKNYFV